MRKEGHDEKQVLLTKVLLALRRIKRKPHGRGETNLLHTGRKESMCRNGHTFPSCIFNEISTDYVFEHRPLVLNCEQ